jgi:hypothetical protein
MTRSVRNALAASLATAFFATAALAGPPLLCWPLEAGGAPSLPWREGQGWKGTRADYDRAQLAKDTLALLGPQVETLARMETLRRAALYAHDGGSGRLLLAALDARAEKASGAEHALALFDAGYGQAVLTQAGALRGARYEMPAAAYRKVQDAIRERGGDPAMEYAAALIVINHDGAHGEAAFDHLRRAVSGAPAGSPLARTLTAHRDMWGDALERARAAVAQK